MLPTQILLSFLIFMLGACGASFLAVVSYRGRRGLSWVHGRSQCEHCQKQLPWWQNIPVWSYLGLGGHCQACSGRIPSLYFWWESLLGSWTAIWFWQIFFPVGAARGGAPIWPLLASFLWLILGGVLIWVALEDIQTQEIENKWLWLLGGLTLAQVALGAASTEHSLLPTALAAPPLSLATPLLSLAIGASFWLLDLASRRIFGRPGLGSGDAWVATLLCWWLHPSQILIWLLASFWLGAAVGVALIWLGRKKRTQTLPFLPFLVTGFFLAWLWGEALFRLLF